MFFQIDVAKDFSTHPAGRYKTDGSASGEAFRDNLLIPKLKEVIKYNTLNTNKEKLYVNFNGVMMAGGSWIEEAFGGAIRESDIRPFDLFDLIEIIDRNDSVSIMEKVREYMDDEVRRQTETNAK